MVFNIYFWMRNMDRNMTDICFETFLEAKFYYVILSIDVL